MVLSDAKTIHAILACLAWVAFFPLGAVLMRLLSGPKTWLVHAGIQVFAAAMFTVAVALGIVLAKKYHALSNYHVLIGLVLFSLMFIQSALGYLQHTLYRRYLRRTIFGHAHVWLGYPVITLAMINGGLGLLWSGNASRGQCIAYGVVTALIWICWIATVIVVGGKQKEKTRSDREWKSDSETDVVDGAQRRRRGGRAGHRDGTNVDAEKMMPNRHDNEHVTSDTANWTDTNRSMAAPSISHPENVGTAPNTASQHQRPAHSRTRTYIIKARH